MSVESILSYPDQVRHGSWTDRQFDEDRMQRNFLQFRKDYRSGRYTEGQLGDKYALRYDQVLRMIQMCSMEKHPCSSGRVSYYKWVDYLLGSDDPQCGSMGALKVKCSECGDDYYPSHGEVQARVSAVADGHPEFNPFLCHKMCRVKKIFS